MNIYYVRHGETVFNFKDYIQGQSDAPLTDNGLKVASILANHLKHIHFDKAYSSDLRRAKETCEIILNTHLNQDIEHIELKEFREINFGKYEGDDGSSFWKDMSVRYQFNLDEYSYVGKFKFLHHPKDNPTGEKLETFKKRLKSGLDRIVEDATCNGHESVLLVGHGIAIQAILETIDGPRDVFDIPNASITKINFENDTFSIEYSGKVDKPF